MMNLRPYQAQARRAVLDHLHHRDTNPVVVIPTGGGKTPLMADLARTTCEAGGRMMILAHVRELLEQHIDKIKTIAPDLTAHLGVYSAGLGRRDTGHRVIVGQIQSVHRRAAEFGRVDLILIDEAHTIPPSGDGMYRRFLHEAQAITPHCRLVGFTATPYRTSTGMIVGRDHLLNDICYEVGIAKLIEDGYLSRVRAKSGRDEVDTSGLHVRGGEFIAGEVESLMDTTPLVRSACEEIVTYAADRRACLIFAAGVDHGQHTARTLRDMGVGVGEIYGDTPAPLRDDTLSQFRSGQLKYLVNVNVLSVGFDAPHIDLIAMLRPTLSPGLYYQQVGRGFRICEGKANCLVLDFAGNIRRHGPVDAIQPDEPKKSKGSSPVKVCLECREIVPAAARRCPGCGHMFQIEEPPKHDRTASTDGILTTDYVYETHEVCRVRFSVHMKRGADEHHPRSLRASYQLRDNGAWVSEWVCVEHDGFPRKKAEKWWAARSVEPIPEHAQDAVRLAEAGALAKTYAVTLRRKPDEKWPAIIDHSLGPIPQPEESYR